MIKYDFIIPLGTDCSIAGALSNLGKRKCSFPFDWCIIKLNRIKFLFKNNFQDFFNKDELIKSGNGFPKTKDNEIYFYHTPEFDKLNETYEETRKKFDRRCERLNKILNEEYNILFIRKAEDDSVKDLEELVEIIVKKFSKINFKILLINNIKNEEINSEKLVKKYCERNNFLKYHQNDYFSHSIKDIYSEMSKILNDYEVNNNQIFNKKSPR